MSSFQSSIEKVVRRIKRVIFFQRLSVIFFIFYQIFKIIISFILRKIDSFGDSFELFLLWTLMFQFYNLVNFGLNTYFWFLSYKFLRWLDISNSCSIKIGLAFFFICHMTLNMSYGVVWHIFAQINLYNV